MVSRLNLLNIDSIEIPVVHGLLAYLRDGPHQGVALSREVADFKAVLPPGYGPRDVRAVVDTAVRLGLVNKQANLVRLTPAGAEYTNLIAQDDRWRVTEGQRLMLRQVWINSKSRYYQDLGRLLQSLLEQGGDKKPVPITAVRALIPPDGLRTYFQHLEAFGVISRTGPSTYRVTTAGLEMAQMLGLKPNSLVRPGSGGVTGPTAGANVAEDWELPEYDEGETGKRVAAPHQLAHTDNHPLDLKEKVEDIDGRFANLANELQQLQRLVAGLEVRGQEASDTLATLHERLERVQSLVGTVDIRMQEWQERLYELEARVEAAPQASQPPVPPEPPLVLPAPAGPFRPIASEQALLEDMARRLGASGYQLDLLEIANLYTCVKSGWLTLLAGPPGTGKSSLVRKFAEAMGHGPTLCEVTVRRGWTDDQPFMGAINRLYQRYEPAPTGVVPHLLAASQDRENGLYWILLDEFNLSTPEYYFAEFISVLESDTPRVSLYAPGVIVHNRETYPQTIAVGRNVHFFATMNLDDTASPPSPRLIDRASVIWWDRQVGLEALRTGELPPPAVGPLAAAELTNKFLRKPEMVGEAAGLWNEMLQILDERTGAPGAPHLVSPRRMSGVAWYVANAPAGLMSPRIAFDFALTQRVLPGIRGFGAGYGERLEKLQKWAARNELGRTAARLERIVRTGQGRGHEYDFLGCLW
jgi:hypothetical protein